MLLSLAARFGDLHVAHTDFASRMTLIDLSWLTHLTASKRREEGQRIVLNVDDAVEVLEKIRKDCGMHKAEKTIALVPTDPRVSDDPTSTIHRICAKLADQGVIIAKYSFIHSFRSLPPTFKSVKKTARDEFQALSPLMCYLIGSAAALSTDRKRAELLVVSGSYDYYLPLQHLAAECKAKVTLAWFHDKFDGRWFNRGNLGKPDCKITCQILQEKDWFDYEQEQDVLSHKSGLGEFE